MANLYIIATPIGNLGDITLRAIETLKRVDFILCEDTRVTQKLLNRFEIKKPTISYHQHSGLQKIDYIINLLKEERSLGLVSDAGTPGISDPGNQLVGRVIEELGEKVNIIPIPGPSALATIACFCGFPMDKFLFLGFPPHKRKRQKFFKEMVDSKHPVIFFESPHRIIKSLRDLREEEAKLTPTLNFSAEADAEQTRKIVVGRELSKKFETIYRGSIGEVIKQIEKDKIKGEFVVVIEGRKSKNNLLKNNLLKK